MDIEVSPYCILYLNDVIILVVLLALGDKETGKDLHKVILKPCLVERLKVYVLGSDHLSHVCDRDEFKLANLVGICKSCHLGWEVFLKESHP